MLDTMPYADLLALYSAIAEKPVARFDTRANGVRRTEALLEMRGLTVAEAARLADVVLTDANIVQEEGPAADAAGQNTLQRRRKPKNRPGWGRTGSRAARAIARAGSSAGCTIPAGCIFRNC
jgi:hypothetical protein